MRDATLTSVTDRLDYRHPDVARRVLDRVDHRLDPLPDHHCLDLDHWITSLRRSRNTVSLHTPSRFAIRSRVPTIRKPHAWWRARLARFSGKTEVWIVQIPAASAPAISASSSVRPIPRPRAARAT